MKLIKTREHYQLLDNDGKEIEFDLRKIKKAIGEVDLEVDYSKELPQHLFSMQANESYSLFPKIAGNYKSDLVSFQYGFECGVKFALQALSDNKKKFTEEDMRTAIEMAKEGTIGYYAPDSPTFYFDKSENEILSTLRRKEWEVEVDEDGNITVIK